MLHWKNMYNRIRCLACINAKFSISIEKISICPHLRPVVDATNYCDVILRIAIFRVLKLNINLLVS